MQRTNGLQQVVIEINLQTNIFGLAADLEEHVVTPLPHLHTLIARLIDEGIHAFPYTPRL
jgi:hypothetical protein